MDSNVRLFQPPPSMPEEPSVDTKESSVSTADETETVPTAERRLQRSRIDFPYNHLGDVIALADAIHRNGGGRCGSDQLAAWLGHGSIQSGTFRMKLAAARLFGLVEGSRDQVALTGLGQQVINTDGDQRQARVSAFLNVPLYTRIYDSYKGRQLPPDAGLEQAIVDFGVSPKQRDKARQAFQRSAETAGLFSQGRTRLVLPAGTVDTRGGVVPPANDGPPFVEPPADDAGQGKQGQGADGGGGRAREEPARHTLIKGLLETLPPAGHAWADQDRTAWMKAAEAIFDVIYKRVPDA